MGKRALSGELDSSSVGQLGGAPRGRGGQAVRAVVLVGGRGTRLMPLTERTPKPLLPVGNRALLDHTLDRLAAAGITDTTLSLGYQSDVTQDAYPDGVFNGAGEASSVPMRLHCIVEETPLGTGGAVARAVAWQSMVDTVIVCYCDIVGGADIASLLIAHLAGEQQVTIALAEVEDPSPFGAVVTNRRGLVTAFVEKPALESSPSSYVHSGTYILEPDALNSFKSDVSFSTERDLFPQLLEARALAGWHFNGYWADAGSIDSYRQANRYWVDRFGGVHPDALIHPQADVRHSAVGAGSVVGAAARVVNSVVGPGCRVEAGARIVNTVLGPGTVVRTGVELVDVVASEAYTAMF